MSQSGRLHAGAKMDIDFNLCPWGHGPEILPVSAFSLNIIPGATK